VDFTFTDEQKHLRKSVREFAEGEIAPHVMEWDESSHFPAEILPQLAEMGLMGVIFPEEYGGAGLGYTEYATVIEELARVDGSVGLFVAAHNSLCSNHIYKFGSEEQKRKYLVPLAQGKKLGAWSLTEPEAGSDAGGTRTTAVRDGKGWTLNGSKTFTTNGTYADICVAMAVTDRSKDSHGISAFILEKGTTGFRPGKKENKLGMRASDTSEVIFTDCHIPAENLLGPEGEGFISSLKILDGGRISIAALGLGMAQGALEAATAYAKQRKQFNQPIADFQAIRFKLADMVAQVDAARAFMYQIAADDDAGRDVDHQASMAKYLASEMSERVTSEALQVFGGAGYTTDFAVERYWRDARLTKIFEGTSEIQQRIISDRLLGKPTRKN